MNASDYEITNGYVGSWGKTFESATEPTLAAAIDAAAKLNNTTPEGICRLLESGKPVVWCHSPNFYYDHSDGIIRLKRTPKPSPVVKCDCGHSVPAIQRMSASLGTSCPDCYDRMSG